MRANFVEKFQAMHRLVEEPDATTTLYIGAEKLADAHSAGEPRGQVVFRH